MTSRIGRKVRQAVLDRLTDTTTGFNATLAALAREADYDQAIYEIDFTAESTNFFLGPIGLDLLLATSSIRLQPALMTLSCATRSNMTAADRQKSLMFAGRVIVQVDVWLTWSGARAQHDFETPVDLVEETLITVFNRETGWPADLGYNGDILVNPGPLQFGAEHFIRLIQTQAVFRVLADL